MMPSVLWSAASIVIDIIYFIAIIVDKSQNILYVELGLNPAILNSLVLISIGLYFPIDFFICIISVRKFY